MLRIADTCAAIARRVRSSPVVPGTNVGVPRLKKRLGVPKEPEGSEGGAAESKGAAAHAKSIPKIRRIVFIAAFDGSVSAALRLAAAALSGECGAGHLNQRSMVRRAYAHRESRARQILPSRAQRLPHAVSAAR